MFQEIIFSQCSFLSWGLSNHSPLFPSDVLLQLSSPPASSKTLEHDSTHVATGVCSMNCAASVWRGSATTSVSLCVRRVRSSSGTRRRQGPVAGPGTRCWWREFPCGCAGYDSAACRRVLVQPPCLGVRDPQDRWKRRASSQHAAGWFFDLGIREGIISTLRR